MNKTLIATALALACAVPAGHANQFETLHSIETEQEALVLARQAEARRQADAEVRRQHELRKQRIAADAKVRTRQAEAARIRAQAAAAAQRKEEAFRDQNRSLDIAERQLRIDAMRTRTQRENDFINAELKRESARTDVIQSQADAKRNVSTGVKSYLNAQGKAEERRAGSFFGRN